MHMMQFCHLQPMLQEQVPKCEHLRQSGQTGAVPSQSEGCQPCHHHRTRATGTKVAHPCHQMAAETPVRLRDSQIQTHLASLHRHEINPLEGVICSCRWLQSQTSVLPEDPGVYNPHTGGSHLQGDAQGVTSRAKVTLANTDIKITSAIPTTEKKVAKLSLGNIRKPSTNCPFITLLHIMSKCSCLKGRLSIKGSCFQTSRFFLKLAAGIFRKSTS